MDGGGAGVGDPDNKSFRCTHYSRRCKIRAPCCGQVFYCRFCHDESPDVDHELPRHEIKTVICLACDTEQKVAQVCSICGITMGEYFCEICKLFDDDTTKMQYHCEGCGICRVGGRENFFHCENCRACYSVNLRNEHSCLGNPPGDCPVCLEDLFTSVHGTRVLNCGHILHETCFLDMLQNNKYACPLCNKATMKMDRAWELIGTMIETYGIPAGDDSSDDDDKVWILCNDCNLTSEVQCYLVKMSEENILQFHKCGNTECNSYNTRISDAPPVLPK